MTKNLIHGVVLGAALLAAQSVMAYDVYEGASQSKLEREVRRELVVLPFYNLFDHFTFRVEGETVTLMGQVTTPSLKQAAESTVRQIEGVKQVHNEIEVLPVSQFDDRLRVALYRSIYGDTALQRLAHRSVPPIHIIVKNGRVTLEGYVANEMQKTIAGIRANSVAGVFSIANNLLLDSQEGPGSLPGIADDSANPDGGSSKELEASDFDNSGQVSSLLAVARRYAAQLKRDTDEMTGFGNSSLSWETHYAKIGEIKAHVNRMGQITHRLQVAASASPDWQQQAVGNILPVLKDLAASVQDTIDHMVQQRGSVHRMPTHKQNLTRNANLASKLNRLAELYLQYGQAHTEMHNPTRDPRVSENLG